jgi:hypothetical protein
VGQLEVEGEGSKVKDLDSETEDLSNIVGLFATTSKFITNGRMTDPSFRCRENLQNIFPATVFFWKKATIWVPTIYPSAVRNLLISLYRETPAA